MQTNKNNDDLDVSASRTFTTESSGFASFLSSSSSPSGLSSNSLSTSMTSLSFSPRSSHSLTIKEDIVDPLNSSPSNRSTPPSDSLIYSLDSRCIVSKSPWQSRSMRESAPCLDNVKLNHSITTLPVVHEQPCSGPVPSRTSKVYRPFPYTAQSQYASSPLIVSPSNNAYRRQSFDRSSPAAVSTRNSPISLGLPKFSPRTVYSTGIGSISSLPSIRYSSIRYLTKRMPFAGNSSMPNINTGASCLRSYPNSGYKVSDYSDSQGTPQESLSVGQSVPSNPPTIKHSFDRLDAFLKPRPPHSRDIVPKFYKSVIDDVLHNVREIFLDDGVDEQVIQELRAVWERKISESRAVEPATNSNDSSSNSTTNSQSNKSSNKSQAGGQTSVITSNPNHVKNGPKSANNNNNNNNNNSGISSTTTIATTTTSINRVKEEIIEEELSIHRQSANRKASSKSQPMLPTVVPTPPPMISNGGLVHTMPGAANLAQAPAPTNHLIRASAIVTNPLGPTGMTTIPSTAPQLIQVLQSNHGNKNDGAPPITHATTATPLQRSAAVMKSQNILNIIPSSSSSFSSVGSSTNHFSHSAIVTNAKDNCGGDIGSSFSTPNVAMTESIVSSNNVATKRINTMPLGHKKRILSYAIAESNSGLNGGSASGSGNLFSIADLAASQPSSSVHNASSSSMQSHLLNLERQQNANRPTPDRVHAMGAQFAHLDAAPGPPSSHGLVTSAAHGGLQSMANQQNSQIIMGTRAVTSGANSKQEVKYPSISVGPAGHKVVLLPNNPNSYVMPNAPFVITPDILSQLQLQGGIITTGPGGHQTVLHHAPTALGASTIQYATTATRGMTPTIQQLRTVSGLMPTLGPAQVGQPGASNSNNPGARVAQFDGLGDSSDDDDDEDDYRDNDDDQDDNDDEINDEENEGGIEDEEPLNSGDDVSDEDPNELFETDNVVVCQYDKITRSRNKWKFHFKDGIMNLQGKDYVFQKAVGDAEW